MESTHYRDTLAQFLKARRAVHHRRGEGMELPTALHQCTPGRPSVTGETRRKSRLARRVAGASRGGKEGGRIEIKRWRAGRGMKKRECSGLFTMQCDRASWTV